MKILRLGWVMAIAILLAVGLARLRFDVDALNLLPRDLPAVQGLQLHQRYFSNSRELLITLSGEEADQLANEADQIAARLRARPDLVRTVFARPPWLDHPSDAAENLAWLWLQQSPAELNALQTRLDPTHAVEQLAATRESLATSLDPSTLARASYDPLNLSQLPALGATPGSGFDSGVGTFQNAEGTFRVLHVEPAGTNQTYRAAIRWLAAVRAEIQSLPTHSLPTTLPQSVIQFTGGPVFLGEIASGMESDLTSSILTTILVIGILFWLAHRSLGPMLWLAAALGVTLVGTLALGGLWFGTLNVLSAGFAAVLLGLVVDYGLVGYQEARAEPGLSLAELRRRIAPGIGWSAITTAGTFALLRWAGLPGLAQLGTLTAIGLLLGAVVMVFGFLPLAVRRLPAHVKLPTEAPATRALGTDGKSFPPRANRFGLWASFAVLACAAAVLWMRGWPSATSGTAPLRPRQSAAYSAMEGLKTGLGHTNEPAWLLFRGATPDAIARAMTESDAVLAAAVGRGEVASYVLPQGFWPRPENARTNLVAAAAIGRTREQLQAAVLAAGFTPGSWALDEAILTAWERWGASPSASSSLWPTNSTASWLHQQFAARDEAGGWLALGLVNPGAQPFSGTGLPQGVLVSGWDRLGPELLDRVAGRVTRLTLVIAGVLVGSLWLAFRRWSEVGLSLAALAAAFGLLLAVMAAVGASWNLLSLVAIPMLLGSSVDSTIHVQLALRRGGGWFGLWRSTGRALVLCAGANVAGFGSLAWSNNAGLASLDLVCAGGVVCVLLVALCFLPAWWQASGRTSDPASGSPLPVPLPLPLPSSLYGAFGWRLGGALVRHLPRPISIQLAQTLARIYQRLRPERQQIVVENLRPLSDGTDADALRLARANFAQFATKLVDLWRFEAGADVQSLIRPGTGWEYFAAAQAAGRGILLVTPHLGNWEFGAPLLSQRNVRPLVLTASEPGGGFTQLRAAARARQQIDTLVVGADPFAFVEVIRRLQAGGVIAVLLDRPAAASAVTVRFLGRPFAASSAAAELARATGCAVLPVSIVYQDGNYVAHVLPPVGYDRRALSDRTARTAFTEEILRACEPIVRAHPSQWYHFVPVWPPPTGKNQPS